MYKDILQNGQSFKKVMQNGVVLWEKKSEGLLPDGYTRIESIKLDGTFFIKLDVPTEYSIICVGKNGMYHSQIQNVIFSPRTGCYLQYDIFWIQNVKNSPTYFNFPYKSFNCECIFDDTLKKITILNDGNIVKEYTNYTLYSSKEAVIGIGTGNYNGHGEIYEVIQKDSNGNEIGHYIPALRNADESIGVYNVITDTFCEQI